FTSSSFLTRGSRASYAAMCAPFRIGVASRETCSVTISVQLSWSVAVMRCILTRVCLNSVLIIISWFVLVRWGAATRRVAWNVPFSTSAVRFSLPGPSPHSRTSTARLCVGATKSPIVAPGQGRLQNRRAGFRRGKALSSSPAGKPVQYRSGSFHPIRQDYLRTSPTRRVTLLHSAVGRSRAPVPRLVKARQASPPWEPTPPAHIEHRHCGTLRPTVAPLV